MNRCRPEDHVDSAREDPRLEAIADAIEAARNPDREGPFGLFDYTSYGDPVPHHVRDLRDHRSESYGDCLFRTVDRDEARRVYERLTREHLAISAIRATLKAFALGPLRHLPAAATADQRAAARASDLYAEGDMQLCWLSAFEMQMHQLVPDAGTLGLIAARDRKMAGAA